MFECVTSLLHVKSKPKPPFKTLSYSLRHVSLMLQSLFNHCNIKQTGMKWKNSSNSHSQKKRENIFFIIRLNWLSKESCSMVQMVDQTEVSNIVINTTSLAPGHNQPKILIMIRVCMCVSMCVSMCVRPVGSGWGSRAPVYWCVVDPVPRWQLPLGCHNGWCTRHRTHEGWAAPPALCTRASAETLSIQRACENTEPFTSSASHHQNHERKAFWERPLCVWVNLGCVDPPVL